MSFNKNNMIKQLGYWISNQQKNYVKLFYFVKKNNNKYMKKCAVNFFKLKTLKHKSSLKNKI